MPRGAPDYSNVRAYGPLYRLDDMAELAVRLGSVVAYDRRGNVIWLDDFSTGSEKFRVHGAGDYSVALETSYPKWPPFCLKMTGGSTGDNSALAFYYACPSVVGKLGVELSVAFFTRFDEFRLEMFMYDGTHLYDAQIRLDDVDDDIKYYQFPFTFTKFADLADMVHDYGSYHSLKLVADFENYYYTRFLLDQTEYDLSAIEVSEETGTGIAPQFGVQFGIYGREGGNDYCHVDGLIITQNEPA